MQRAIFASNSDPNKGIETRARIEAARYAHLRVYFHPGTTRGLVVDPDIALLGLLAPHANRHDSYPVVPADKLRCSLQVTPTPENPSEEKPPATSREVIK